MQKCLAALTGKLENHEIAADELAQLRPQLEPIVAQILAGPADNPLASRRGASGRDAGKTRRR